MKDLQSFSVEIPVNDPDAMRDFQVAMNAAHEEINQYINSLAVDLGVSDSCAADIFYLRTRSRHTDELEQKLIRLHRAGTPPNICEFGC